MVNAKDTTPALLPFVLRQLGTDTVNTVNARDLHAFLEIAKEYSTWIKTWLRKAHLVENKDYAVFSLEGRNPQGGRPSVEYHLTFDAAKCIGMMSGSPKGDEVRAYFLACEKATQEAPKTPQLHNPMSQVMIDMVVRVDTLEYEVEEGKRARQELQAEMVRAEAKIDTAVHNQNFWTIAEYVQYHGDLRRQCPESAYVEASNHMRDYCKRERLNFRDPNVLPRRIPVGDKGWQTEWGFHTSVYEEAFLPWLLRRNSQRALSIVEG